MKLKGKISMLYAAIIVLVIGILILLALVFTRFQLPDIMTSINDALHIWG